MKEDKIERSSVVRKSLGVFMSVILISSPVFAARPLVTDNFRPVEKGKIQIEAGSYSSAPSNGSSAAGSAAFQVKYGLAGILDLGLKMPYSFSLPVGFGDGEVNAKLKLAEYGKNSGLALKARVKLSNGEASSALGTGYMDYSATVVYSREISGFRTHYNLGYTLVGVPAGTAAANTVNYSAAMEKEVYPGADIVLEFFGKSASSAASKCSAQIGGKWQVDRTYRVDTGYSVDFDNNSQDVATIGVTFFF